MANLVAKNDESDAQDDKLNPQRAQVQAQVTVKSHRWSILSLFWSFEIFHTTNRFVTGGPSKLQRL